MHSDEDKGTRTANDDEMEFTVSLDLIITIAPIVAFGLAVVVAVGNMSRSLRNELRGDIRSLEQKMDRRFEAIDRQLEAADTELRAVGAQCQKCLRVVKYRVIPAALAASITSWSRIDPPGATTAVTPA